MSSVTSNANLSDFNLTKTNIGVNTDVFQSYEVVCDTLVASNIIAPTGLDLEGVLGINVDASLQGVTTITGAPATRQTVYIGGNNGTTWGANTGSKSVFINSSVGTDGESSSTFINNATGLVSPSVVQILNGTPANMNATQTLTILNGSGIASGSQSVEILSGSAQGTATCSIGAGSGAKTITIGNSSGATAVSITGGTGGVKLYGQQLNTAFTSSGSQVLTAADSGKTIFLSHATNSCTLPNTGVAVGTFFDFVISIPATSNTINFPGLSKSGSLRCVATTSGECKTVVPAVGIGTTIVFSSTNGLAGSRVRAYFVSTEAVLFTGDISITNILDLPTFG